jgi:serine/threonine protein kinase
LEARGRQDRPESAPEGAEQTRELTAGGGQFLLRADVVEFRRGDLLGGRYQIEKGIGRGATGSVLQAFDRVVRSVVAVKILRPDLATDQHWIERLGGELRYARKLQHPNVCRVFDLGESDGHHYLTMEFAGGGSLRQRLADKPARSWEDRIADARSVIEGLVAIHAANIVHRDVKPENVLVMDDGRLAVSDFGVAVSAGQTTYFSSKVAGTPSYMAPEVIMGDKATPRADVFSLGIVLHEILFGRRPDWQMTPKGRVIKSVVAKNGSTREKAFSRLCAECLKEFAPERLADAAEVKRRFEQAVAGRLQPIVGLRKRWPLAVAAVAVLGSVGAVMIPRNRPSAAPEEASPPVLVGKAVDLAPISRLVLSANRVPRCFDILPDRRSARVIWDQPTEAVDIDLTTGKQSPSPLIPDVIATNCPQVSPDGQRLLYVKGDASGRSQIMLSSHLDGREGVAITEGSSPSWMPSGDEFVYAFDNHRAAAFTMAKTRLLFPDSPPVDKRLLQLAVGPTGDKVALLFQDGPRRMSLETYGYPSMRPEQRVQLAHGVGNVLFDPDRHTLQLSVPDPRDMSLVELDGTAKLSRLGEMNGVNILAGYRTEPGFAFVGTTFTLDIVVRGPHGSERTLHSSMSAWPDVSNAGDLIFDSRLDDGRSVVAFQPANDVQSSAITEGPADLFPTITGDGKSFAFVRSDQGAIVLCGLSAGKAGSCQTIHVDSSGPRFTRFSPDNRRIAYQTMHSSGGRLRVLSVDTRMMTDLGISRSICPPVWSSNSALWIREKDSSSWKELDATNGRPTGRTSPGRDGDATTWICNRAPDDGRSKTGLEFARREQRSTQIRLASRF